MGQFKPMVKMETTEPSIELKLKKGGAVKKADGGMMTPPPSMPAMPARGGMAPAAAPMKPSMAARRRAMMARPAGAAPAGPVGMAGRMMKEGGESKAEHAAEMKKFSKLQGELKSHESKPASKAHKGLKTGGVVMGQGGFKEGGIIKSTSGETRMVTAKPDHSPAKTGDVKLGNGGGYKAGGCAGYATGGVAKANAGGYKKGGAAKKAYATGGLVDTGRAVAMPQGHKKPPTPVSINQLSGTYKKGGRVKMAAGGMTEAESDKKVAENEAAYQRWKKGEEEENKSMAKTMDDVIKFIPRQVKKLFTPSSAASAPGAVTKTKESVTTVPAKKRGGAVTC